MSKAKGYCEDITEGKFSFPIIHAIRNSSSANNEILNILKRRPKERIMKENVVAYMRDVTKSFEHTKKTLDGLKAEALRLMTNLNAPNEAMDSIMSKLIVS